MTENTEFKDWVLGAPPELPDPNDDRFPLIYEDEDGDRTEFLLSDEDRLSERVDGRLTIYRGRESGAIVGGSIKGLKKLSQRLHNEFPGFAFCVRDNKLDLVIVFAAAMLKQDNEILAMQYRSVFDRVILHSIESRQLAGNSSEATDNEKLCDATN